MARLAILEYPDPRLRTVAEPVTRFDDTLRSLVDDLFETLHATRAIGLAATQVDVHQQVVVMDVSGTTRAPQVFINPVILTRSAIGMVEESCLSVPGVIGDVRRSIRLRVRTVDLDGHSVVQELEGLAAVCLQHEMDHLEGRLFVDRLPFFKRLGIRWRIARQRSAAGQSRAA